MSHPSPNDEANAMILAKIRNPDIRSRHVLRIEGLKLLAGYGPHGCERQVHYFRESEIAKWTGIEWRASPRMTQREAKLAGMDRCARESPWLFAAGALDLSPDVTPGPASFAPAHHVDPTPRKVNVDGARAKVTKGLDGRTRVFTDDNALLASATDIVRAEQPELSGPAFHQRVSKMFHAMRNGQREAALRDAKIPKQPTPAPVPVKGGAR